MVMVLYLKAIFKKAVGIKIDMVSMFLEGTQKAACGIVHCPNFFLFVISGSECDKFKKPGY